MTSDRSSHTRTWTSLLLLPLLLLLLLPVSAAANVAISPSSSDVRSASASAGTSSANQRSARSADAANSLGEAAEGEGEDASCSSDFVERFFRLLSGPVGKEGEAVVAAVLKLLSENDRVNWPDMMDWSQLAAGQSLPASKLRETLLAGARRFRGAEKRLAPKFNPTGWRRRRSADRPAYQLDSSYLRFLLAKLRASPLLEEDYVIPKMSEDDVKLVPGFPEWQEEGKRSRPSNSPERVSRRRQSPRMPKRKPLEFNPTGW